MMKLDAVDYLLKPITLERLVKAVNKLSHSVVAEPYEEDPIVDSEGFIDVEIGDMEITIGRLYTQQVSKLGKG